MSEKYVATAAVDFPISILLLLIKCICINYLIKNTLFLK